MVPNGSDLSLFTPRLPERGSSEPNGPTDLRVVYAGTHGRANGLGFVLSTAKELQDRGVANVCFVLVGDGSEKPKLLELATNFELSNIEFLPPMPKEDLANLMPGLSIGLQVLARVEGFENGTSPNKFFDYLASGLPVVTNYPGWVSEVVSDYRCGWTVESTDELADLLQGLASDSDLLRQFGARSRSVAENLFDREEQARRACEIIEGVLRR